MRWTAEATARYDAALAGVRTRMRCDDRLAIGRITAADVYRALVSAGYARTYRYVRAVLSGCKRSRPCLRECSAAVGAIRKRREVELADWL